MFKEEDLISFMLSNKLESSLDKVLSFALSVVEDESTADAINRLPALSMMDIPILQTKIRIRS